MTKKKTPAPRPPRRWKPGSPQSRPSAAICCRITGYWRWPSPAKFRAVGGDDALIGAAFAAAALAIGAEAFDFAAHRWGAQLAPFDPRAAYLDAVAAIAPAAPRRLVHLAQCAVQVCRARWRVLEWQIEAAYADNVPEDEIAEAITLAMFPGSIPRFVEACGVWRGMIAAGRVAASERYKAWAALTGQGGFDEVLAKTSKDK